MVNINSICWICQSIIRTVVIIALNTATTATTTTTWLLISLHEWHTYVPKQMIIDLHVRKEMIMHFNTVCIEIFLSILFRWIYLLNSKLPPPPSPPPPPPPPSWQCVVNNPKFASCGQVSIYRSIHLRLESHIWPQQVGSNWSSYELFHPLFSVHPIVTYASD